MRTTKARVLAGCVAALTVVLAGCGGSSGGSSSASPTSTVSEFNPAGDIPDNQVYVPYSPPGASYTVKVPEGWSRTTAQGVVTFTDKLNSIQLASAPAPQAPTVSSVSSTQLPKLAASAPGYAPGQVTEVQRTAGSAVLITYQQDSKPDPVTGKVVKDAVERYEFWHQGTQVTLTLSGPVGADNVDPWRIVTDSLKFQ